MDLPHIASRLFGTPLMFARPRLDAVLAGIGPRIIRGDALMTTTAMTPPPAPKPPEMDGGGDYAGGGDGYETVNGIAVIPVHGSMVRRGGWLAAMCGMTSYDMLAEALDEAVEDGNVRAILLDLDTGGGEAGGVFDLARKIAEVRRVKPVWAIANEAALSAGYAIACPAERIWLTQTAEVGSIGVVAVHVDQSAADAEAGLKYTYIFAGDHKVDGNSHEPLPDGVKADIQADIDDLYGQFVALVAQNRGLSPEAVRATKARIYRGQKAIAAGLADQIGTMEDVIGAMVEALDRSPPLNLTPPNAGGPKRRPGMQIITQSPAMDGGDASGTAADQPPHEEPMPDNIENLTGGELPAAATGATEPTAEEIAAAAALLPRANAAAPGQDANARAAEITSICKIAEGMGIKIDAAAAIANPAVTPGGLRAAIFQRAAEASAATNVVTAAPPPNTAGDQPKRRTAVDSMSAFLKTLPAGALNKGA